MKIEKSAPGLVNICYVKLLVRYNRYVVLNIRQARQAPTPIHVLYTFSAYTHNAWSHSKQSTWPWGEQMYLTSLVTLNPNTHRERTGEFEIGLLFGSWRDRIYRIGFGKSYVRFHLKAVLGIN